MNASKEILEIVESNDRKLFTGGELKGLLNDVLSEYADVKGEVFDDKMVEEAIADLIRDGNLIQTKRGRLGHPRAFGMVLATMKMNERGFGFARVSKEQPDFFVYEGNLGGALDMDTVLVRPFQRRGKKEAEVIRIVKRFTSRFVGVYDGFGGIDPDDPKVYCDFKIKKENSFGARKGEKVVIHVTDWNDDNDRGVYANIVEVLGKPGDVGLDILSIAKRFGLDTAFPADVIEEAQTLESAIDPEGREDFRDNVIFTIDGADAKDLDDAIHIRELDNGYELGVHIADVSHYVIEGSEIDEEAERRGTSVYLLDRVIPMLPERLSNDLCSLNPNEDKYALSAIMIFDKDANLIKHRIVNSIIRSSARLNYEEVSDYLEGVSNPYVARISDYYTDLRLMLDLALKLRAKRQKRGAVDFDFPEPKIILAENGVPTDIIKEDRRIGNILIEEFMLIANETVAEHFFWLEKPFIYRVHESPDKDRVAALKRQLDFFGIKFKFTGEIKPSQIAKLIEEIKGSKYAGQVSKMALRSMMQARYSNENLGHFGLAAKYYCHFTSPIRRYPDLFIHRVIKDGYKSLAFLEENVAKIAENASDRERNAENTERVVEATKMAEYMLFHLGERFEGTISSVTNFGFFVELDNLVDGLVHINSLNGKFEFDDQLLKLVGLGSKKTYSIGDRVLIEVVDAEPETGKIDFELVNKPKKKGGKR